MSDNYTDEHIKDSLIKLEILNLIKRSFSIINYESTPMITITVFNMIKDLLNYNDYKNSESKDYVDKIYNNITERVEETFRIQSSTTPEKGE